LNETAYLLIKLYMHVQPEPDGCTVWNAHNTNLIQVSPKRPPMVLCWGYGQELEGLGWKEGLGYPYCQAEMYAGRVAPWWVTLRMRCAHY